MGPRRPRPTQETGYGPWDQAWALEWVEAVVEASSRDTKERLGGASGLETVQQKRQAMKLEARERFPWTSVAELWKKAFVEQLV